MPEWLAKLLRTWLRPDPLARLLKQGLIVGRNCTMLDEVIIDPSHAWHIRIGNDVTLAPRVHILAHDASTKRHLNCTRVGKVFIGDRVFVGASTLILPGVTIGSDVIIGAGSVVTKDVPPGVVAAGNPARVLLTLQEFLEKRKQEREVVPYFGQEFTIRGGVSDEQKAEMNRRMVDGIGYIV